MIPHNCPGCTKKFSLPDNLAGRKVKCPKCGTVSRAARIVPPTARDDTAAAANEIGFATVAPPPRRSIDPARKNHLYLAVGGAVLGLLVLVAAVAMAVIVFTHDGESKLRASGKKSAVSAKSGSRDGVRPPPSPAPFSESSPSQPGDGLCGCGGCCGSCLGGGILATLGGILMIAIPALLIAVPMIAGIWTTFRKAGEPGWAAVVPVYSQMIMAKIAGKGESYGLLCLIPFACPVFLIIIIVELCKRFDVGGGFAWGVILLPLVFWPILGLGSARYIGDRTMPTRRRRRYEEEDEYGR